MKRKIFLFLVISICLLGFAAISKAVEEPKKLFEIKTGKKIETINFARNDSVIVIKYKMQLWAYDNINGKKLCIQPTLFHPGKINTSVIVPGPKIKILAHELDRSITVGINSKY